MARTLRSVAFSAVLTSPLALVLPTAAPATAATVPPPPTKSLPAELDVAPAYQKQVVCDPTPKPGPLAFAQLLNTHYGTRYYGIGRACAGDVSEHYEGRALDWMVSAYNADQKALADSIVGWLSAPDAQGRPGAMARRFGINYIIWNRKMWRAYAPERGWADYTGVSPHTDHIHITFTWDGAYKRTSWWTGKALTTVTTGPTTTTDPTATSTGYPLLTVGSTGEYVAMVQKIVGATIDGDFGPMTKSAVVAWQSKNGVPATGAVDDATWQQMIALGVVPPKQNADLAQYATTTLRLGSRGDAVKALQRTLGGLVVDGDFGLRTDTAVRTFQKAKGLRVNGVVDANVWTVLMGGRVATPPPPPPPPPVTLETEFTRYKSTVLGLGSTGAAVRLVQSSLGGLAVDGSYGARTAAAVAAYRERKGLIRGTVVKTDVWDALERDAHPLLPFWSSVARRGASGSKVVALQRALRIAPDGDFGPRTEAAVRAAQQRAGLSANGMVGTQTWRVIERQVTRR